MKLFLALGFVLFSAQSFSQSYLILNNGVTLTIDKAGFVYDFNHFTLPYKVSVTGGQFFIEDSRIKTVDASGFFYEKDLKVEKVKGHGLNYLITDKNDLITVDANGFVYKLEDDKELKKVNQFGGNFFLTKTDLYTVNDLGNYFKTNVPGLNLEDITVIGGHYFQTKAGTTYTVSRKGFVYSKPDVDAKKVVKAGGKFFIDETNRLFTISDEGLLTLPVLPFGMNLGTIQKIGSNFLIDSEGRIFVVDSLGNIFERSLQHDLKNGVLLK